MRQIKILLILAILTVGFYACSKNDPATPTTTNNTSTTASVEDSRLMGGWRIQYIINGIDTTRLATPGPNTIPCYDSLNFSLSNKFKGIIIDSLGSSFCATSNIYDYWENNTSKDTLIISLSNSSILKLPYLYSFDNARLVIHLSTIKYYYHR
jgi:hypothetical protein